MCSYLVTYTDHDNYTYVQDKVVFWNIICVSYIIGWPLLCTTTCNCNGMYDSSTIFWFVLVPMYKHVTYRKNVSSMIMVRLSMMLFNPIVVCPVLLTHACHPHLL